MADEVSSNNLLDRAVSEKRKARDFEDLQHELSDRDVGRISRFLSEDHPRNEAHKRTKRTKEILSALDLLLQDDAYRQAYEEVFNSLTDTETLLHDALLASSEKLQAAEKALKEARERGASAEEIRRLKREYEDAQERHAQLMKYDDDLQRMRDRMQDKDNPPTQDDLDDFEQRIGKIQKDIERHSTANKELKPETDIPTDVGVRSSDVEVPSI